MLTRSVPATASRREHGVIERQLKNLTRMVDDLLDIQRLNHGKLVLARRRVALAEIIETAVETTRRGNADGHTINVTLPEKPIIVFADPVRLGQVVGNLLENALKFTPVNGTIEIAVEPGDSKVAVRVSDTGMGISPELLEGLFDMYAQADPFAGGNGKGLGVGLNLVRQIVDLHDGTVTAHSAGLNQGSEFIVRLPLTAEAEMNSPEPPAAALEPAAQVSSLKRVMIVDDNQDSAEAIAALLASSGFTVRTSHDGALGLQQSRVFKPQAAILDIGLPGMDGFELARRLRSDNPDILLIALSGWRQDPSSSEARVFDHYLTKPIEISAIESLLSG